MVEWWHWLFSNKDSYCPSNICRSRMTLSTQFVVAEWYDPEQLGEVYNEDTFPEFV